MGFLHDMVMRYSQQNLTPEDEQAVLEALRSPYLTQGPKVEEFEAALCEYTGAKHCVVVSSGTAALHLAYLAAGVRAVITSPLTFVATANAALLAGASVGFVDVDTVAGAAYLHSGTYWPRSERLAYVPVHFAGRATQIQDTRPFGHDVITIEDACHALGANCQCGCGKVGNAAHSVAVCMSFHPVKPLCTAEGGCVLTNNGALASKLRLLRSHGRGRDGLMTDLGLNYRMTELQAALGISQLHRVDKMRAARVALANAYENRLQVAFNYQTLTRPYWGGTSSWHLYPVRIKNGRRDEVKAKLNAKGIGAQVHYNPIVPLHPYYRHRFGYMHGDFPNAEAWAAEELSLPLHAGMTEHDVETVVSSLREALA